MKKIGYLLLTSGCLFTSTHLSAWWWWNKAEQTKPVQPNTEVSENHKEEKTKIAPCMIKTLQAKVTETIAKAQDVPGFSAEEFSTLKPKVTEIWNDLVEKQMVEGTGIDEEMRPQFQALQNIILHVLATELKKEITNMKGLYLTPLLPLSFCIDAEPSTELDNLMQPFSIHSEAQILRDILQKEGHLQTCYLKDHLTKRTEQQLAVYAEELAKNPKNLIDTPIATESIPTTLIGSMYFFIGQGQCGHLSVFASNIPELIDKTNLTNFGLWFGRVDQGDVWKRPKLVMDYLEKHHVILKKE